MKHIIYKNYIDLYGFKYHVTFDVNAYMHKTNINECDFDGVCFYDGFEYYLICLPLDEFNNVCIQTLAHECFHMTDFVMDKKGIEFDKGGTNEHLAYLLDHIVGQVLERLEDYKKFLSKGEIK